MSTDPQSIRATMRLWTTGVTVVTSAHDGRRAGLTASSFTSVSLEPPLILVCVHSATETYRLIAASGAFGVSVLGAGQAALAEQFAGHNTNLPPDADRFHGVAVHTAVTGAPLLDAAIAWLDCRVTAAHPGGTHVIVVGEIQATGRQDDSLEPLVYYNRAYRNITP